MSHFKTYIASAIFAVFLFGAVDAQAQRYGGRSALSGGDHQLGLALGITNTSQEHMNTLISRANTRAGGISTSALNQAYEGALQYGYRFSGSMLALLIRPSFFYQKSTGGNSSGNYNYSVTGFTVFPILRIYPLENDLMKFFFQFGLGYGRANGTIEEATAKTDFAGGAYGALFGAGTEFCFVANHCVSAEANYRYLTAERNIASSVSGTFASDSLNGVRENGEVEMDDTDLATRMGGLQFLLGYAIHF